MLREARRAKCIEMRLIGKRDNQEKARSPAHQLRTVRRQHKVKWRKIVKIKLFGKEGSKEALGLEDEVNAWLAKHPQIKIVEIKQSASGGSLQDIKRYISVWYEDA
jgi:hypothetical protein